MWNKLLILLCLLVSCTSVKKSDTLVVGISPDYPPFALKIKGELAGTDVEMMHKIGRALNKKIEFKEMDFHALIPALLAKKIDLAISGVSPTQERRKKVLFTNPYYIEQNCILFNKEKNHFTNVLDLKGKVVATTLGVVQQGIVEEYFEEMQRSYLDYAMSVIVSRALPDVRDGLKPVHRRILFAMKDNGWDHTKPHRKSARIVGEVMAKYHPHGDMAIYDAMARMVQDFSLRVPLIDGQGNFGSMDGDSPAAARYTEARLEKIAQELLVDIDKNTVMFADNYDGSLQEPTVLPARFPNLLVNGAGGIAVGMATNIPPHNLGELLEACEALIHNPDLTISELAQIVKGPDFPTGGIILGTRGILNAFHTSKGGIVLRAKTEIETFKGPSKDSREQIVVTEIPYQVNKAKLVEHIAILVRDKEIEGISEIRDESNRHGIRIVMELKRDANGQVILNQLFKFTQMQVSFGANILAIVKGRPQSLDLKSCLMHFFGLSSGCCD